MRQLTTRTKPLAAYSSSRSARPFGHRPGEGALPVLPGSREDTAQRPERAPDAGEHPTAAIQVPQSLARNARAPGSIGKHGMSLLRLTRCAWAS